MSKRFPLTIYQRYWYSWRGVSITLIVLSLAMLWFVPTEMRPYQLPLALAAALGALTLVLGYGMTALAFVSVGKDAVVVQLPLWRVRIPLEHIYASRTVTLAGAAPDKWRNDDAAQLPAVYMELRGWAQPRALLRFWMGNLLVGDGMLLPTPRTLELRQTLDSVMQQRREALRQQQVKADDWSRPAFS